MEVPKLGDRWKMKTSWKRVGNNKVGDQMETPIKTVVSESTVQYAPCLIEN